MDRAVGAVLTGVLLLLSSSVAEAQTLRGSTRAMYRQNRVAQQHDYSFLQTSSEVRHFADLGLLVRLSGNNNYMLASVSHPYTRPAVKMFVERLGAQYRAACGEKLVVTSLTRPAREQPRNASDLSVHPAGMAVDLRISKKRSCRKWIEKTLLSLERQGLLEAGRERRPPHYHVALFPEAYTKHVARVAGNVPAVRVASASAVPKRAPRATTPASKPSSSAVAARAEIPPMPAPVAALTLADGSAPTEEPETVAAPEPEPEVAEPSVATYRTRRGDTLWSIARRHGTTVQTLRSLNGLKSSQLVVGQVISVPTAAGADGS
jgi:LysM repeat protein